MGGTMSAMYASLFPEGLKNLILMTAPIEFPEGEMGLYSLFTSEKYMNPGCSPTPSATSRATLSTPATGCSSP
jgi:pimeloyl-ACP methyl ester carboxylesterase